jgi:hypothetical protein
MKTKDRLPQFTPRWLYRFLAFIERLPIPSWQLALLYIIANAIILNLIGWNQGAWPTGSFDTFFSIVGLFQVSFVATWLFLTRRARSAIQDFFKNRKESSARIDALLSDFVSVRPPWDLVFFLFGALFGALGYFFALLPLFPLAGQVAPGWILVSSALTGGITFLSNARFVRQSVLAQRLYRELDVDLFNPTPVYALSRYAAAYIVTFFFVSYLIQSLVLPGLLLTPYFIAVQAVAYIILVAFFFAQIFGVNQRMRRAKEQVLTQLSKDVEKVHNDVHKAVQRKAYNAVGKMQATVSTLRSEQEFIQRIPTWPWQPETLRNLLAPLLLPVIVYLVQRFAESIFGF